MISALPDSIIPGRTCAGCTLCCKILEVREIGKPPDIWCSQCDRGKGCRVYSTRPEQCEAFHCGYLTGPHFGPEWWPQRSKIVLDFQLGGARLAVHVDPGRPGAWRDAPYYGLLKLMASTGAQNGSQVVVFIGRRAIVLLPHEDVDLGVIADDEQIVTAQVQLEGGGVQLAAFKMHRDHPYIAGGPIGVPFSPRKR